MKQSLVIIFCTLVVFSCRNKYNPPKRFIQPQEMKEVLWDMTEARELSTELSVKDTLNLKEARTAAYIKKVLEVHEIDSARFAKSYQWYVSHPEAMNRILDSLYEQKNRERELPKVPAEPILE